MGAFIVYCLCYVVVLFCLVCFSVLLCCTLLCPVKVWLERIRLDVYIGRMSLYRCVGGILGTHVGLRLRGWMGAFSGWALSKMDFGATFNLPCASCATKQGLIHPPNIFFWLTSSQGRDLGLRSKWLFSSSQTKGIRIGQVLFSFGWALYLPVGKRWRKRRFEDHLFVLWF